MVSSGVKVQVVPLDTFRQLITDVLYNVKAHSLPQACKRMGIQSSVGPDDAAEAHSSKRLYISSRIADYNREALIELARKVLDEYSSDALADALAEMTQHGQHRVSQLVRRDVLKVLNRVDLLFGDLPVIASLEEVFTAEFLRAGESMWVDNASVGAQVLQHYVRNPDWSHEEMLIECGALTCSQVRFFALLEKLVHPMTRRDDEQAELATAISDALKRDGFTLKQTSVESQYPIFSVVRTHAGVAGTMKNLIFASTGEKPELVFRDALNNDVEITKHADKVLVYDQPLPNSGMLLWSDLRDWYAIIQGVEGVQGAKMLYTRLRESVLGAKSPGEFAIFHGYYDRFSKALGDRLPALIPQVYLHYDPYTRRARGDEKFLVRQRMDFLLMLERGVRIVIEIDGSHHYAVKESGGQERYVASPRLYAEMAAEDRRLRLMGYEVYRFGGHEFLDVDIESWKVGPLAQQRVADFFDRLLAKHEIQ